MALRPAALALTLLALVAPRASALLRKSPEAALLEWLKAKGGEVQTGPARAHATLATAAHPAPATEARR